MNILFSTVGRRGYIVDYFREYLPKGSMLIGTSDRNDCSSAFTSGFSHCDKSYIVPSIKNEHEYIEKLLDICKTEKVELLLSFYDYDVYVLSKYLDDFGEIGVTPVISSRAINTIAFDKIATFDFLTNKGFYTPWTLRSEEIETKGIPSYPVIVKPRFGFGSNALSLAHNKEEVDFFLKYYNKEEMMVQEFIEGAEYSFDILNDFHGRAVTAVVKRKMFMRSGETDQGYAIKREHLQDWALKLGNALGHTGPLDVDFFLKDGQPYILELNPRFGGGYPMTHLAGVNFPKMLIDLAKEELKPSDYELYRNYEIGNVMVKDILIIKDHCLSNKGLL